MLENDANRREVGPLMLERGLIDAKQLEVVQRRQRLLSISQHQAIIELNFASESDTYRALAELHHLEFVDVANLELPRSTLELVPSKFIFHHQMLPLGQEGEVLVLAFGEPPRPMEQGNLKLLLNRRLKFVLTTPGGIQGIIKRQFGLGAETIQRLRDEKGGADLVSEEVFDVKSGDSKSVEVTIANFADQILLEALRLKGTDIHLEPYPSAVRLRYRVDGVMQSVAVPSEVRRLYPALVSRLKIMAGLNIAEKRLPQDGRISMKTGDEEYDLRASVIPTKHGEAICLRVLGRQSLFLDLGQLGMEPAQQQLFAELTRLPQGFVLLTGPTGSGKTTTLYAALAHANDEERKIITIEDPIEYQLEGISQIQVREDIGLTFSSGLRSILRHDPDVVLIGEIRDIETAEIAVRAAQTGHLVFSTLHTNDSVAAISRLIEMRIDPFLIGSSLVCSIAQRLAQRVCPSCGEIDPDVAASVRAEMAETLHLELSAVRAMRGRGCPECGERGYRGRVALYEFFVMTEEIADMLGHEMKTGELRAAARRHGWRPLREMGWQKVQRGLIPVAEQERLTHRINPEALVER
jgi:general secretion pathway protein E/type IV pilus assembly protein PilB